MCYKGKMQEQARDSNVQFFNQFKRVQVIAQMLGSELRGLTNERQELWQQLLTFQKKIDSEFRDVIRGELPERKRFRRSADLLQKEYECPVANCFRNYSSEGSLAQHIRLKHPDYSK